MAAAYGLATFRRGYWVNDPEFQRIAMIDLGTDQPRIHFGQLRNWFAGIGGVAEALEELHGRALVEVLRFVASMTVRGGTMERLLDGADDETTTAIVDMIDIAAGRARPNSHGGRLLASFPRWDDVALYAPSAGRERFVAVLTAGWDPRTSDGEVNTPREAVAAMLGMLIGPGSGDTTVHVHDRESGELHRIGLNEVSRPEGW
ncbi:hypothetical protein [Nocardia sp. NRRL S-836]|uniref:hypothetical protein n=1 Tax=Nocardia sp. NRRL S-836 TaxID=1519492 RepID=UPI0012F831CC|nr:hypothetical protein [Nocardia sp. NRRL S-836]